jgi:hypothetical protein
VEVKLHHFDLGTGWRLVVNFTPSLFIPEETTPNTHWIGGWVDPKSCSDTVGKRRSLHCQKSNLDHPSHSYTNWDIQTPGGDMFL